MPSSIKREFNYSVTNLDWDDGTELEFTENPKLFDRLESLEHTYEMPGFYTIKGLVYKKALQLVNIYPPVQEDSSIHYEQIELENNDENHDFPSKTPIKALLTSADEESYLALSNLNHNRSGSEVTVNLSARGGYLINEVFRTGTDIEIIDSEDEFDRTIGVNIPAYSENRLRNAGVRFNMGLELDVDRNNYFVAEFDAWLPNFGRYEILEPSPQPSDPPEAYNPSTVENTLSIHEVPGELNSEGNLLTSLEDIISFYDNINSYDDFVTSISEPSGNLLTGITGRWNPGGQVWRVTYSGFVDDTNPLEPVFTLSSILFSVNDDYSGFNNVDGTFSDDNQWIWDGNTATWNTNPNFEFELQDTINNPTQYVLEIRLTPENEELDDHREQFFFSGTNNWQTIRGDFFASSNNYKSMFVEFRQLDRNLDISNETDPWKFYIKNIEMKIQNTNNIKFPLQWERFKSNIVLNSSPDYDSPFFEKNNIIMIGGMSKESYYYKSLSSLIGYDFNNDQKKVNFSYDDYNPYDVILALDTLAKFDNELYDDYLNPYTGSIFDNNGNKINNGMIDKKFHSSFKDTALTDTDITSVRLRVGVKPMWEQLGLANDEFDKPDRNIYWKNIIPKDFDLSEREGITQRDLPDPMKGSLTPRIPRKEFIIDEEATQNWNGGYFWPALPKFNKYGGFSDEFPPGYEGQTYGDDNSSITSLDNNDASVLFDLSITDDDILDTTDNHDVKQNVDFTLELNSNNRIVKSMEDFSGTVETDTLRQAF